MFLVLMGVFSFVFHSDRNYRLNLIVGLFLYDFFSDATKTGLISLRAQGLSDHQGEVSILDYRRHVDLECRDHARDLSACSRWCF